VDAWLYSASGGGFMEGFGVVDDEDAGRCGSFGGARSDMTLSQSRVIIRSVAGLVNDEIETSS
jgi:hypothetical protein